MYVCAVHAFWGPRMPKWGLRSPGTRMNQSKPWLWAPCGLWLKPRSCGRTSMLLALAKPSLQLLTLKSLIISKLYNVSFCGVCLYTRQFELYIFKKLLEPECVDFMTVISSTQNTEAGGLPCSETKTELHSELQIRLGRLPFYFSLIAIGWPCTYIVAQAGLEFELKNEFSWVRISESLSGVHHGLLN